MWESEDQDAGKGVNIKKTLPLIERVACFVHECKQPTPRNEDYEYKDLVA
jgi:hypothetical protein